MNQFVATGIKGIGGPIDVATITAEEGLPGRSSVESSNR